MDKKEDGGSSFIRDLILGGQDGLVNVLGIVLAVAKATQSRYVILVSGLAACFAESISMAAVAYTSGKAGKEYYEKQKNELSELVRSNPTKAKVALREVYAKCGLQGTLLNRAIQEVLKSPERARNVLAGDGSAREFEHPVRDALVVGFAAIVGSLIPLVPFMFVPIGPAVWATLGIATLTLFGSGAIKGSFTAADPFKSGLEMAIVGMAAAISGYLIGAALGALPLA